MTAAMFWGLLNEVFMLSSATMVGFGWYHIKHKHIETHRKFMLTATVFGAAFFVSYLASTFLVGDTYFGGPSKYNFSYQTFLIIHILLATAAAVLGVITLRLALMARFNKHRKVAPWTATFWFVAAGTGLAVFLLLFVVFHPGPTTTSIIDILRGRNA